MSYFVFPFVFLMNHIIYDLKMPGILGAWHGAYYKTQFADLSIDNLREVGIPIGIAISKLYPADPGHSPLAAVKFLKKTWPPEIPDCG